MEHHAIAFTANSIKEAPISAIYKVQSADVRHYTQESFSIHDARLLAQEASTMPVESSCRVFVIEARTIAVDAQNALLKLFEEPPSHARFYLVIPASLPLLPTLRSRLAFHTQAQEESRQPSEAFRAFALATYGQRIALIAEKTKAKDAQWIEAIVHGCEAAAHGDRALLQAVIFVRTYMPYKGSSMKMLLEHLALSLQEKKAL